MYVALGSAVIPSQEMVVAMADAFQATPGARFLWGLNKVRRQCSCVCGGGGMHFYGGWSPATHINNASAMTSCSAM